MRIGIPDFALVVLIGTSGSGKSTFAQRHFRPTEIVSSDACRALVADDETDQSATKDAFDVLYTIVEKRLAARRLTVIDATNLRAEDRAAGVAVARKFHAIPVAIVLDIPAEVSLRRNDGRANRNFGPRVVREQSRLLRASLPKLRRERYAAVYTLNSEEAIDGVTIAREPLFADRRTEHGPFDIIGDVHGCIDELRALLTELGYEPDPVVWRHPAGRRAVFLGDLVDRGPGIVDVLRLVMAMVRAGSALCVPGNHENKLGRALAGKPVTISHGLAESLAQIEALPQAEREPFVRDVRAFIDGLISHYWLDDGKLVVAHAGLREAMHGRGSREVREFALYGETTGETDEFGFPVRYDWAAEYRGKSVVVYGHTPVPVPEWVNQTICVDTGCVYGGALTALRYPELTLTSVPAARTYVEPVRPLVIPAAAAPAQQRADDALDLDDIIGKRRIETRYGPPVLIPAENAAAALEVMSRFCVDPRWLVYLPPTMSPAQTSARADVLEHPDEALQYFRRAGVERVVLEEKHMGSRAVVIAGRDADAIARRFGIAGASGEIVTRTGRAFFVGEQRDLTDALLGRLRQALSAAEFWDRFATDWVCFDAELMPWSAKAQELIDRQYAPVGEAALADLGATKAALERALERNVDTSALLARTAERYDAAARYSRAYRTYVSPVGSVDDLVLAPFHLLATEGAVHADRDHVWHMREIARICEHDPALLKATAHREVDLNDENQVGVAVAWWEALTSAGGEGVVVKPLAFVARERGKLIQPALKVRGREYLRVVYGPEYTLADNLERLRERSITGKRRLALAEFSLGLEALQRFVERAPLRSVHECVFGVLACESEPIDPRL